MTIAFSTKHPLVHQIVLSTVERFESSNQQSTEIQMCVGAANYRIWNSQSISDFLETHYAGPVLSAFHQLKPFSYKADLARYCILNHFGGVYADLSVRNLAFFDTTGHDMVIFRDLNSSCSSWKVATNFFFSRPNNPILLDAIEQCVDNTRKSFFGRDPHSPTGPSVLGRSVARFGEEVNLLVGQYYWLKYRPNKYFLPGWGVVARHKRGGLYRGGQSGVQGGNNYNEMWNAGDIYSQESTTID